MIHQNPQKIAIVGSNGRLGRAFVKECESAGKEVVRINRDECDLSWNEDQISGAISDREFDLLLVTAALTDVDGCERNPRLAEQVNVDAPRTIAGICAERGVRMIHFSTDYVFDGRKTTPYTEADTANPLSVYGKTKLRGEQAVLEASSEHLVVRVSWLFGEGPKLTATPDWAVAAAVEKDDLKIVTDKTGSPTYAPDVAEIITGLFANPDAKGLLHACGEGECTWREWGQHSVDVAVECGIEVRTREIGEAKLADFFGSDEKADRPPYTAMSSDRLRSIAGRSPRDWKAGNEIYVRETVVPRFL